MSLDRYADILHVPRPISTRHRPMELYKHAAQFAPFAALTGFDEMIDEQGRWTDSFAPPGEEQQSDMNRTLTEVLACPDRPRCEITYFVPDAQKSGGRYVTISGVPKRVQLGELYLSGGTRLPLDSITELRIMEP